MQREIYIVDAFIVDANGNLSIPDGYPKTFDSKSYSGDADKAERRAEADASTMWAQMCNNDAGRQIQAVYLYTIDGFNVAGFPKRRGKLADLPDPTPQGE